MKYWFTTWVRRNGHRCLRLDWPKDFGPAASGTCPTCDKYIQVNLGKHVALYHLDLAQLWRCPVDWCSVWKGISQDCVDHMRRAHNTPISVKAGSLARWFPPWTVTREQWHSMSRPSVSGIAIDTFLFSHIGMPLFHRYRVFDRLGSHPAFRGPYMSKPRLARTLRSTALCPDGRWKIQRSRR